MQDSILIISATIICLLVLYMFYKLIYKFNETDEESIDQTVYGGFVNDDDICNILDKHKRNDVEFNGNNKEIINIGGIFGALTISKTSCETSCETYYLLRPYGLKDKRIKKDSEAHYRIEKLYKEAELKYKPFTLKDSLCIY